MDHITNLRLFTDEILTEDDTAEYILDQIRFSPDGFYTVFLTLENVPDPLAEPAADYPAATVKLEWLGSIDGGNNYLLAETDGSESLIAESMTSTGGYGTDGKYCFTFDPYVVPKLKFRLTETGSVTDAHVKVNAWLCIQ